MLEIRSKRRTRSGRQPPHVGNDLDGSRETYPGRVYISAHRSEARRASTSSTLRPTPNPLRIPRLSRSALSRISIPHLYPTPLLSSHLAPYHLFGDPSNSLSTRFHVPSSLPSLIPILLPLTHHTHISHTSHHLAFQIPSLYDITNNITICYILLGTLLVHFSQIYLSPLSNAHSTPFRPLSKNLPSYPSIAPSKLSRYKISYPYHPPPEK